MGLLFKLFLGKNGRTSMTKITAWLAGLFGALQVSFPNLIPPDIVEAINSILIILGGIAVKDAIDKTAPAGTEANPEV